MKSGKVAPWFGEKGKGVQHYTDLYIQDRCGNLHEANVKNLLRYEYIRKLD